MARQFSSQQLAIIDWAKNGSGNCVVSAYAGTGKTTTMIEGVCSILSGSVKFVAFGKAIAAEGDARVRELGLTNVNVSTVHSVGMSIYRKAYSGIRVDGYKLRNIARQEFNGRYESWRPFVISACEMAKQVGIGIYCDVDNNAEWISMCEKHNLFTSLPDDVEIRSGIDAAQHLLNVSNQERKVIDFSDMIYLPLLLNLKVWQHDWLIVDECQDLNFTRRELVRRMIKPTGRLIAVGDANQAIFGFTGADHDSMDILIKEFNTKVLPLSVTYRCPKNIVQLAQQWVSDYTAHENAPDGIVDSCELQDVVKLVGKKDAILCRNTRPLVDLAYTLLRNNIGCKVEGRAIGEGLIAIAKRWKSVKNVGQLRDKLDTWAANEMAKAMKKEDAHSAQNIEDKVQTLEVFMSQCDDEDSIAILINKIESLFVDTKQGDVQSVVILSTIHKAKGREWGRVFALGMNEYSPSKFARQEWELQQEDNLCYVQVTRAKSHLTLVNVPAKRA